MKLSIVTPSLNQLPFLRETAASVLSQAGPFDLEWIVTDGGSTDGTVDWLRSQTDPRLAWTSEPDHGQSDAINKGLARATGDVVAWLNADDLYEPGALAAVADAFTANPHARWLVGRYAVVDAAGRPIRSAVVRYKQRRMARYTYARLLRENVVPQMATFWRRDFGQQVGPLDTTLHWTMDYDLWLRMGRQSDPLRLDRVLAKFRLHAASKSGALDRRQFDEQYAVACRYFDESDRWGRLAHRMNVEKVVWAYRALRLLGR